MKLIGDTQRQTLQQNLVEPWLRLQNDAVEHNLSLAIGELHAAIPPKKRGSYGRVHVMKELAAFMHRELAMHPERLYQGTLQLFQNAAAHQCRGIAIGILGHIGVDQPQKVLPHFEQAATHEHWEVREYAQGFFRPMIKPNKTVVHEFLVRQAQSQDENARRFASETLRPVRENRWLFQEPEYSISVLRHLFCESAIYPRTSVGNNLSDLSRKLPELIFSLVAELVAMGNEDAQWIAQRACRNLVKQDTTRVLDVLALDEYTYKNRHYAR